MKKIIVTALIALPLAFSARAQWIVYDPTMNIEQIVDEAENIAKYVTMIDNQVQQINTLTNQLSEFKNYESLFGNPSQVVLSMVPNLESPTCRALSRARTSKIWWPAPTATTR